METLDCSGLECPMPIVELARKMRRLSPGEELNLITTSASSEKDVLVWCDRTGNRLLRLNADSGRYFFHIRKLK